MVEGGRKMKYWDIRDKYEGGIFISFDNRREAQEWLDDHKKRFPEHAEKNGMHIVECERQTLGEKYAAQEKEIDQLRAQVARMKEAIEKELANGYEQPYFIKTLFDVGPLEYHNPADIEALRLAKEALDKSKTKFEQYRRVYGSIGAEAMAEVIDEALVAIEQIGGKEDV
jgi:hypothetical protein